MRLPQQLQHKPSSASTSENRLAAAAATLAASDTFSEGGAGGGGRLGGAGGEGGLGGDAGGIGGEGWTPVGHAASDAIPHWFLPRASCMKPFSPQDVPQEFLSRQ